MLKWIKIFLVLTILSAIFGFTDIGLKTIARVVFFISLESIFVIAIMGSILKRK